MTKHVAMLAAFLANASWLGPYRMAPGAAVKQGQVVHVQRPVIAAARPLVPAQVPASGRTQQILKSV